MRKWLAVSIQIPFIAMMWVACSGDDSGVGDAGDASSKDVTLDKKTPLDVAVPDTGPSCTPDTTIDTNQLSWSPPAAPNPSGCSDQQISDLYSNCYDQTTATQAKCTGWLGITANKGCYTCMVSVEGSAKTFGALIDTGHGVIYPNVGGCIALVSGDPSDTGCGATYWKENQCEDIACTANCTGSPFSDYQKCTQQSRTSVCAPFVAAECNLSPDAGPEAGTIYDTCLAPIAGGFAGVYPVVAALFCGGYAADGGAPDSGTDAASTDAAADAPDGD